mgnify:CR=1 FL=1
MTASLTGRRGVAVLVGDAVRGTRHRHVGEEHLLVVRGAYADERGSREYNLALGQRRAAAVVEYLQARGIDASRFDVTSMGEEMPAVPGDNEGAWAQNRRAEFEVVAGELTNIGG